MKNNTVKFAVCILLVFSVIISFASCTMSSSVKLGYVQSASAGSWKAEYNYLDGSESRKMYLSDNETSIKVTLTTVEGSISVVINDSEGNNLYTGNGLQNESFGVGAEGEVTVTVTGEKHKGSFEFVCERALGKP